MPFVRPNDITMHYDFAGPHDAPIVLLVNSLASNVHMWDEQINALARGHRVLRYDMRGHGLTDATPGEERPAATIAQLADDALALMDALGVNRVSLVGLSIGGMVGQRVAARYPERVDALVLCATGNRLGTIPIWDERLATVEREGLDAIVDSTIGRWFTEQTHAERPELIRGFANMVRRTPKAGYLACGRAVRDADLRADDALIRVRTLVVAGAHDAGASPATGAELRDAITGAELQVMQGAAHILNAEQPIAFNELLLRFLEAGR